MSPLPPSRTGRRCHLRPNKKGQKLGPRRRKGVQVLVSQTGWRWVPPCLSLFWLRDLQREFTLCVTRWSCLGLPPLYPYPGSMELGMWKISAHESFLALCLPYIFITHLLSPYYVLGSELIRFYCQRSLI